MGAWAGAIEQGLDIFLVPRPVAVRRCAYPGCVTRLAEMNGSHLCFVHGRLLDQKRLAEQMLELERGRHPDLCARGCGSPTHRGCCLGMQVPRPGSGRPPTISAETRLAIEAEFGTVSNPELARRHGVSLATVGDIGSKLQRRTGKCARGCGRPPHSGACKSASRRAWLAAPVQGGAV